MLPVGSSLGNRLFHKRALLAEEPVKLRHLRIWPAMMGLWAAIAQAANPVYVGARYGLFRSTDAGATWTFVNIPLNNPFLSVPISVSSLSMDPHDPSKIYFIGLAKALAFFAS